MSAVRVPAHESTSAQLSAAYPFASARPLPSGRVLVGRDLTGGPFVHDPFALYQAGVLTNPNMAVVGQIGRGKSALVKTYLYRQAAFGRQVAVLDPKGEYEPLATALGVQPIRLSPKGGVQINPLESVSSDLSTARHERLVLLRALAEATMKRRVEPREHLALETALDVSAGYGGRRSGGTSRPTLPTLGAPTLPAPTLVEVVSALLEPSEESARSAGTSRYVLEQDGRDIGLELRRLVRGDLAGMFDGATSALGRSGPRHAAAALRPHDGVAPLIVDLSAVYHSEALGALMVCAAAWLQSMTSWTAGKTLLVVDEAWAVLSDVAVGRYLRSSWKLARARGLANIAVCHRVSDLSASGSAGSEEARLAEGLLADSETVVCYAQPASEIAALAEALGCTREELRILPSLRRGVALWRVAGRSFLVEHLVGSREREIVDTDDRLRESCARSADGRVSG